MRAQEPAVHGVQRFEGFGRDGGAVGVDRGPAQREFGPGDRGAPAAATAASRIFTDAGTISGPMPSGSRAEVGSSKSISFGSMAKALAMATRCCCPPERVSGLLWGVLRETYPEE